MKIGKHDPTIPSLNASAQSRMGSKGAWGDESPSMASSVICFSLMSKLLYEGSYRWGGTW